MLAPCWTHPAKLYFSRASFKVGHGPLSLEPLIWHEDPFSAGPPIYLIDRMSLNDMKDYAEGLKQLKNELLSMNITNNEKIDKTIVSIDGTLNDIYNVGGMSFASKTN